MQSKFLIPHSYRRIGWFILVPFLILGVFAVHMDFEFDWLSFKMRPEGSMFDNPEFENFTNELAAVGVLIGLMLIAFAREKVEDEFIMKLRLDSLVFAIIVNYVFLLLAIVFLYGFSFFYALVYNMYTPLILFIARFYWIKKRELKMIGA